MNKLNEEILEDINELIEVECSQCGCITEISLAIMELGKGECPECHANL